MCAGLLGTRACPAMRRKRAWALLGRRSRERAQQRDISEVGEAISCERGGKGSMRGRVFALLLGLSVLGGHRAADANQDKAVGKAAATAACKVAGTLEGAAEVLVAQAWAAQARLRALAEETAALRARARGAAQSPNRTSRAIGQAMSKHLDTVNTSLSAAREGLAGVENGTRTAAFGLVRLAGKVSGLVETLKTFESGATSAALGCIQETGTTGPTGTTLAKAVKPEGYTEKTGNCDALDIWAFPGITTSHMFKAAITALLNLQKDAVTLLGGTSGTG
ncbi:hypothetical protein TRVL_08525 [Trypanosoma vivax]|nr:hypothetical protein TRVL_08525 [Trypanosoma vivax]